MHLKLSDRYAIEQQWKACMDYPLDLDHPKTFSEKLQWLKLYDRKSIYHQMVDKVDAKTYINNAIGGEYAVPTLGVWNRFERIDWDFLPQQFVLKATHDSGSFFIVKEKSLVDRQECKDRLYKHWRKSYYKNSREWQYKGLKHRIMAEPLIADPKQLREYKFFCFNGEPKFYQICMDRDNDLGGAAVQCVGIDGTLLDMQETTYNNRISNNIILNPQHKEQMISIAKLLSKDMCFLRVDFFETKEKFYVGELTLHESAGFCFFSPDYWNITLGGWIHLPID